jgi:hypothetical protein
MLRAMSYRRKQHARLVLNAPVQGRLQSPPAKSKFLAVIIMGLGFVILSALIVFNVMKNGGEKKHARLVLKPTRWSVEVGWTDEVESA